MTDVKLPERPAAFRRHYPEGGVSQWYDADIEHGLLGCLIAENTIIEFAYTAAQLTAAVMEARSSCDRCERAEQAAKGSPVRSRMIPTHYAENIWYAAMVLERSASVIDQNEAKVLCKIARLLADKPQPPSTSEDVVQSSSSEQERSSNSLSREDGDVHEQD